MGRPALNAGRPPGRPALARWPVAPRGFSPAERDEWRRLGKAAMAAGHLTPGDLLTAELYATSAARLAAMRANPTAKSTAVNSLTAICARLLAALGLTPAGRKALPVPAPAPSRVDEIRRRYGQ